MEKIILNATIEMIKHKNRNASLTKGCSLCVFVNDKELCNEHRNQFCGIGYYKIVKIENVKMGLKI